MLGLFIMIAFVSCALVIPHIWVKNCGKIASLLATSLQVISLLFSFLAPSVNEAHCFLP